MTGPSRDLRVRPDSERRTKDPLRPLPALQDTIRSRVMGHFRRYNRLEPRLVASRSDQIVYILPDPDLAGRTALRLRALEFSDQSAKILPPPHLHRHRYHGVFAPNAPLRRLVTERAPTHQPPTSAPPPLRPAPSWLFPSTDGRIPSGLLRRKGP